MLKNDYLLAKIGFDTAESERCEVLNIFEFYPVLDLNFAISPHPLSAAKIAFANRSAPAARAISVSCEQHLKGAVQMNASEWIQLSACKKEC